MAGMLMRWDPHATFAAVDEAQAVGSPAGRMARTVVLHDHAGLRVAVIPAFPAFDLGAPPPFSALLGTPEILDPRLLAHGNVLCSGGDHRHALKISPREVQRLGEPLVAEVCQAHRALSEKHKVLTDQPQGDPMPATKQTVARPRATAAARARAEDTERRLEHVMQSLESAQKDLASIGGSVGTGVRDLRTDVNRLLRDARRDVLKMRRSVQRDLVRLQKDLSAAATAKPAPGRRATAATARTARRRNAASSH